MTHEATGIPPWAVRGRKVVCVEQAWTADEPSNDDVPNPVNGEIYTLDGVAIADYVGCYLVGFPDDCFYELSGFRPLVTDEQREADLVQFRKLLTIRQPELVE